MLKASVTIVDYGMCNLLNLMRAFEHCGVQVTVTGYPKAVGTAERLVVPGAAVQRENLMASQYHPERSG